MKVVVLAGGTGGARLARGFAATLSPAELTVVTNTADDAVMHGLLVCPDTDSVLYRLAGCFNEELGFGIAGDTFNVMAMLEQLGAPAWFRLGDRDIAVQVFRDRLLSQGASLTEASAGLAARLGVSCAVLPMSDDPVRTMVRTENGEVGLQEWFVRDRCRPPARGIRYEGAAQATATAQVRSAVAEATLIVIGPSNPLLSIDPILRVLGPLPKAAPVLAVSPLVGGHALKGPTESMFRDLGLTPTALGVAEHYAPVVSDFVLDTVDADLAGPVTQLGMRVHVTDTVMRDAMGERRLASALLDALAPVQRA